QDCQHPRQCVVQREWEVHTQDAARLEQVRQWRNGFGIARNRIRVHAARRTERTVDLWVRVEPSEDDDDALDDPGAQPTVQAHPRLQEPSLDRFDLMLAGTVLHRVSTLHAVRELPRGQEAFEVSAVRMRNRALVAWVPQGPRRLCAM